VDAAFVAIWLFKLFNSASAIFLLSFSLFNILSNFSNDSEIALECVVNSPTMSSEPSSDARVSGMIDGSGRAVEIERRLCESSDLLRWALMLLILS
jgi:hypothetical protein